MIFAGCGSGEQREVGQEELAVEDGAVTEHAAGLCVGSLLCLCLTFDFVVSRPR